VHKLILSYVRNLIHFILFYIGVCGDIYSIKTLEKIKKKRKNL